MITITNVSTTAFYHLCIILMLCLLSREFYIMLIGIFQLLALGEEEGNTSTLYDIP